MVGDSQQPPHGRAPLRIELLAPLQGARECLGDKVKHELRTAADPPAQVAPDQRVAALIQEPEPLSASAGQQLLVTRLGRHLEVYTAGKLRL